MRRSTLLGLLALALAFAAGYLGLGRGGDDGGKGAPDLPRDATRGVVQRVVDGDTVVLAGRGRMRLIGVDTPEVFGGGECFGPEASAFTKRMLSGRSIRYTVGKESRDRYGRVLVYLWLPDGRSFNDLLLSGGYARILTIRPNDRYAHAFAGTARAARSHRTGLWGAC